jgi:hypothetical protein
MRYIRIGLYLSGIFIVLVVFTSCAEDDFREACLESAEKLEKARDLLEVTSSRDVIENGKAISHAVTFDNTKAREYLESKEKELSSYYQRIKSKLEKSNKNYADALYVLALINEVTYFISGKAVEEHCHYLRIIRSEGKHDLSEWVLDEVFGPTMFSDKGLLNEWHELPHKRKQKDAYRFLMVPSGKGEKCP